MAMAQRILIGLIALLAAVQLSACAGFEPMYARPSVAEGAPRIEVRTPKSRTGYLLREQLEDAFAWDRRSPALYRLMVDLRETRIPRGLDENRVATRFEVRVDVTYALTDLSRGVVVLRGAEPINVTYDTTAQPYSGIAAQQDSQVRAAYEAAERIKTDVLTWLSAR